MANLQQDTELKTKTHISQGIGIAILFLLGAGAAAAMLFFNNKLTKDQTTTTTGAPTNTNRTVTAADLTNAPLPSTTSLSESEYQVKLNETQVLVPPTDFIDLVFSSPAEGSIVTGDTPVSVMINDPNHLAAGVRFETFNDRYNYHIIWGLDSTSPYGFTPNLGLYPSGEYRHVAMAIDDDGKVLINRDIMVTFAHSCYYVASPDVTLTSPTTAIEAGKSFTATATVKNYIRGRCNYTYNINLAVKNSAGNSVDGWTTTFTPSSPLQMKVGETKTVTLNTQVPNTTPTGNYNLMFTAQLVGTGITNTSTATVSVTRPVSSGGGGGSGEPLQIPVE